MINGDKRRENGEGRMEKEAAHYSISFSLLHSPFSLY